MTKISRIAALSLTAAGMLLSCTDKSAQNNRPIMEVDSIMTQAEIEVGLMTPEVLWKMGRIGKSSVSPDGSSVVYTVTRYNMEMNKGVTSLFLVDDKAKVTQLTDNSANNNDPQWSSDGKKIYFLSDRTEDSQLWSVETKSMAMTQISLIEGGIDGFGISTKGDRLYYIKDVQVEKRKSSDIYPELDKSKAKIYDDLMVRHWNRWDEGFYKHIFVADLKGDVMGEATDIMPGEAWDAPMAPYYDASEISWNNAGTELAYTCKKLTGTEYSLSTDSDIFLYNVATGLTKNITLGMLGYDRYPTFSPDDSKIAFQSMKTPGYESDKDRLFVVELNTDVMNDLTKDFDYSAQNILWSDNSTIYFIAPILGTLQICRTSTAGDVKVVTNGDHDINSFSMVGKRVVAGVTKHSMATELFDIDPTNGNMTQLTQVNRAIYDNVNMGKTEKRWVKTTDDKMMLTWVIYPPDFDPAKKYPTLLYCQGGPQSIVSQFWSYRWNFQLMAAKGYIIVAPNRRGTPSFGQKWLEQISGDYSGQNIRDYMSAIDNLASEPFVDKDRLGCVGASYGGYSAFYLMGHHNKRFKAFISHCGIFNMESKYGSTEELWFPNFDYGGPYWDKNPVAQKSYANSPHKFVDRWDTPILIVTGLNDFRIPYTQSLEAFTAARLRGLPSRLVAFEDEGHQVFKPQNAIVWNREFFGWLDKYVKDSKQE